MGYDGTLKFDTKVDDIGFNAGIKKIGSLARTAIAGIASAVVGLGAAAVKVGSDFEAAMSNVAAISGATGDELEALTAKAQEMGAKTKFSASESAEAFSYMAMAGWKTEEMLNGIEGIMNLAAASGEDLATTSDIVTDALTAFGLTAQDSAHFADILAAASSNANTNVGLMGETFKYVAPVAGALGFSAEDTAQAIGLMANAGIKGSMAGTALRSVFTRMAKPTKEVQQALDALNLSLTDENGKVKALNPLLQEMREKFAGLSDAEKAQYAAAIAGQQGMSGLLAIVNASDEDWDKLAGAIDGCTDSLTGYSAAEEMAAKQLDNLQGQFTILKSALEGFGIQIYQEMDDPLKDVVVDAQDMVKQLSDAFSAGGFTGLVSAAGDVLAQIVEKIATFAPQLIDAAVSLVHSFCEVLVSADGIGESGAQLVASLIEGFWSVEGDLRNAAANLITQIAVGLEGHDTEIMQSGIDMVLNVVDGLISAEPELIPAVAGIVADMATQLTSNADRIAKAAIELVKALVSGIVAAAPELVKGAVSALSALAEAIPQITQDLLSTLPSLISEVCNFFAQNVPLIVDAGVQLFGALVEALPDVVTAILRNLPSIIGAIVVGLLKATPKLIGAVAQMIGQLVTALPQLLLAVIVGIGQWIGELMTSLGAWLASIWESIATWFSEIPGKLLTAFETIIQSIATFGQTVLTNAGTWLANLGSNIVAWLTDLPYKVGFALGEVIGTIIKWGADVISWIATNVPVMIETVVQWFATLPGRIWELLTNAYQNVVQWGQQTYQSAVQFVTNTINSVVQWFQSLPGKVRTHLNTTISNIISFGSNLVAKGRQAAQNLVSGMVNTVSSLPGKMASIGSQIVQGVWRGIQNMAGWFWSQVTSFFSGIVNGVKRALGIKSPSRVFANEVGRWIPPGVGLGVEKAMPDLIKQTDDQMQKLAKSMQTTVTAETSKISFEKSGQKELEQATDDRRSETNVNVTGKVENERPIVVESKLYLGKKELAREITPAVNHEMYKIDNATNNRGKGN